MDWLLLIANFATSTLISYQHQTNAVANSSYPVIEPPTKVAIVMPAFNEEAFIERTLRCIQTQNVVLTYPELFEVIVVDNGSTDKTAEIASQYAKVISAPRIPEQNVGILNARHRGIEEAEGEIIVFMDADIIAKPNYLNLLLRHFHRPEVVAVGGGMFPLPMKGDTLIHRIGAIVYHVNANIINSFTLAQFHFGICALRKEAYYAMGGFDFSLDQFSRGQELERNPTQKLKKVGKIVWDTEANVWTEPRIQYCKLWYFNEVCDSPYCLYCRSRALGERF